MDAALKDASPESLRERSAATLFLANLFRPPCLRQWEWLHEAAPQRAWQILAERASEGICPDLPLPASVDVYEQEFLATFEVGLPQPLCPLIESHWNRSQPVPKVLHENLLFYRKFGLRLREDCIETPDHLRHQAEFLAHVCRSEALALETGDVERARQYAQCGQDFLTRHLGRWIPLAAHSLSSEIEDTWPTEWLKLAALIVEQLGR